MLTRIGLEEFRLRRPHELSGGQQQRVALGRALVTEPAVLLLDEPSAGMNGKEILELIELIRQIRNRDITVILIEHNMQLVMDISDRVMVLEQGRKLAEGTPEEIRKNPDVIKAYLGESSAGQLASPSSSES